MSRIDEIIKETINNYIVNETVVDKFTPWDPESKMDRMQPSNASRSQGTAPTNDYGTIRGYNDWKDNFKHIMGYREYCRKFNLSF